MSLFIVRPQILGVVEVLFLDTGNYASAKQNNIGCDRIREPDKEPSATLYRYTLIEIVSDGDQSTKTGLIMSDIYLAKRQHPTNVEMANNRRIGIQVTAPK